MAIVVYSVGFEVVYRYTTGEKKGEKFLGPNGVELVELVGEGTAKDAVKRYVAEHYAQKRGRDCIGEYELYDVNTWIEDKHAFDDPREVPDCISLY